MKFLAGAILVIYLQLCVASTNPPPVFGGRQSQPRQDYNEILINTDRLVSTIEHKLSHLVKTEINSIRQELSKFQHQTSTVDKVINNFEVLKNSLDTIQDECLQRQIFDISPNNGSKNNKIDNIHASVTALRQATNRIEKELAAIKKSTRTTRTQFNQPVMYSGNNLFHDHESACISSDLHTESGLRRIKKDFYAYCEMTHDDGNWIVISNRFDGSTNFFRNWQEYKDGFGNIAGEYWLGLEKIHELTSMRLHELMIVMEDYNGQKKTAKYSAFGVTSESLGYALNILGTYSGNAGDCLSYHAGMKFSTIDSDNDEWSDGSCSKSHFGGWWYNKCDMSNPNGLYFNKGLVPETSNELQAMHWKYDKKSVTILKSVKMMIRPVD